ncbi:hypothetical protein LRP88_05092 [Fusarium phalaenopsidis]|nr:hypothetical protein NCS56_00417700 [Fusarium sp. Ph1]
MAGNSTLAIEQYMEQMNAYMECLKAYTENKNAHYRKQNKKDLYLELLERYNTMPIYITDPAIFRGQCATAMSEASGPEEFVEMMADVKEKNMAEAVTYVQDRLAKKGGRCPGLSCLVSMDSMLDLAGVPAYEGAFESDSPTLEELNPEWLSHISAYLPERSEYVGGLPPDYLSSDEDSQSDYSESSGDEEPGKPKKSQKRGASRSNTGSLSTSASTEGRTLRNGKRTRTPDDADTVVGESPKNKRRRKGETASTNKSSNRSSSSSNKGRNRSSNRSNSSHSASPPRPASAPASVGEADLLDMGGYPQLRRSGRLNRITGRRSLPPRLDLAA